MVTITVNMKVLNEDLTESQRFQKTKINVDNVFILRNFLEKEDVESIEIKTREGGVKKWTKTK